MDITTRKIKQFFTSMRWKMMATYFLVILITLGLMSIYILGVLNENLYENERIKLFAKANIISDTVSSYMGVNEKAMKENTMQILAGTSIRGIATNLSYTVQFDTSKESDLKGKIFMRDIIKTALGGEQASAVNTTEADTNIMAVAVPIKQGERIIGAMYLTTSVDDIDQTIGYIKMSLYVFSALISILVGMLSLGMSYIITSPVDEFISVAKEISKGNFNKRVKVKGHTELAQMAETLNYMCDELAMLEEKRKNFVSDASHELKTPLSTIKLICDSVVSTENPDEAMVKEFLGDLSDEVDRLTRVVERLLVLTKLDSEHATCKMESVDVVSLLNAIVRKLTPAANAKNIVLYTEFGVDTPEPMLLDYDKIWEAIYNIVDNAIKYSPDGGFVKVSLAPKGTSVTIYVEDNGPGIPESEKDRIFERFYRLDDSRARDTGGTGLGLAIAREAVMMHGGEIEVSGTENMGSMFSITLPYINK